MKIIVTGASGFLGGWVVKRLLEEGHEVFALLRKPGEGALPSETQTRLGDVTSLESLENAFSGMDGVFHLAGVIGYHPSMLSLMEKVNVEGTYHVLEACRKRGIRNLLYVSSVVAIGAGLKPSEILNEKSNYNLENFQFGYFETKRRAEQLVMEAHQKQLMEAFIVNPSTIYGAGDALKGSRKSQVKVAQGKLKFYPSGGSSVVGVEDLVDGMMRVWTRGRSGERYILAGENLLIKEIFSYIAEIAGVSKPWCQIPDPLFLGIARFADWMRPLGLGGSFGYENAKVATMYHYFDSSKARAELGYNPRPAREAIEKSVLWMRQSGMLDI